ncbi:MAG: hypothetical protein ABIR56_05400 [Polaromonas sp.]
MNHFHAETATRLPLSSEHVSSDFMALASHMTDCQRSRGRFFALRTALETLHAVAAPRLVTTGAILVISSFGLIGLGLLTLA